MLCVRNNRADPDPHALPKTKPQHLAPEKNLSYLTPGRQECGHVCTHVAMWDSGSPRGNVDMATFSLGGRLKCLLEANGTLEE